MTDTTQTTDLSKAVSWADEMADVDRKMDVMDVQDRPKQGDSTVAWTDVARRPKRITSMSPAPKTSRPGSKTVSGKAYPELSDIPLEEHAALKKAFQTVVDKIVVKVIETDNTGESFVQLGDLMKQTVGTFPVPLIVSMGFYKSVKQREADAKAVEAGIETRTFGVPIGKFGLVRVRDSVIMECECRGIQVFDVPTERDDGTFYNISLHIFRRGNEVDKLFLFKKKLIRADGTRI